MKRNIFSSIAMMMALFMLASAPVVQAQSNEKEDFGQLAVSGVGKMKVLPDLMKTYIEVQSEGKEFKATVDGLKSQTDQIVSYLVKEGFDEDDIEILRMAVNKHYDYRNGERIDLGYMATQSIQLTSDYSADKLGDIVDVMGDSPVSVPFSFGFTLKQETRDDLRKELIEKAVEDARDQAKVLARAADVDLKGIKSISYGSNSSHIPIYKANAMMDMEVAEEAAFSREAANLEVRELELEERVSVSWKIED